jgi:hypothetical protein
MEIRAMRRAAAIALFTCLPLSAVMADVYRSVDAQGHVLYSDTPSPGAQLIKGVSSAQARSFTASASSSAHSTPASSDRKPVPRSDDQIKDQLAHEEAARAVANDVANSRADQCKKAQETYEKSIIARRIYNEDKNGERTYLSDADADQQRVNAKLAMDQVCKS